MSQYLGLDAGGSCARWAVLDADGHLLRSGERRPWREGRGTTESVRAVLVEASAGSDEIARCVAGVAGASDPDVRRAVVEAFDGRPVEVVGDTILAAAATLWDEPGVALWSGTGSFAVARGRSGHLLRVGGRGPWLGDQGSGFDVVRRACAAAVAVVDGTGAETALLPALERELGAEALAWPVRFAAGDRAGLAAAFATVCGVAANGDPVAGAVVSEAASALAAQAESVARRAELSPAAGIRLGGGAFAVTAYAEAVMRALAERGWSRVARTEAKTAPAAARLARALDAGESPQAQWVRDGAP